jgi:SusD family.
MKLKHILTVCVPAIIFCSCNYLDFDETSGLNTKEDIYRYFNKTKQMLTNVYTYIPQDFGTIDGAMRDCACDDAEFGATGGSIQDMTNGNWSALKPRDDQWTLYEGIRASNEFLESMEKVDFSRYEYTDKYQTWMEQLAYFPYEARVLRAYYFFELARRYGDIAMPLKVLTPEEANSIRKTSFDDVIAFIVSECDDAAAKLPKTYQDVTEKETGRITKGFAMALKSKALLYAASPLHSPDNQEKWKASARAAYDIIKLNLYQLDPGEKANNLESPEVVLFRRNDASAAFERNNFPIRFTEGTRSTPATATFPSQNLVDAFQTLDGYPVTLGENGWICNDRRFDPQNPYDRRDPRLALTVLANGMPFKGSKIALYKGGDDDAPVSEGGSPTGYFLRKYIQESTNFVPDQEVANKHHWIIYRYAETLLTYAESMVMAFGPTQTGGEDMPKSATWALNEVRANAGMPALSITDKDEFIKALQNEWRVEFAFEDHRFWDVRRWMIGNNTQKELYGVSIEKGADGLTFKRKIYKNRYWNSRMNLYPIPLSELNKNENLNPQNTGW